MPPELLLILTGADLDDTRRELERRHLVLQVASPRVLIIQRPDSVAAAPDRMPGVFIVTDDALPDDLVNSLTTTERQWIAAWRLRQTPKHRIGDGLSWDVAELETPDDKGKHQ